MRGSNLVIYKEALKKRKHKYFWKHQGSPSDNGQVIILSMKGDRGSCTGHLRCSSQPLLLFHSWGKQAPGGPQVDRSGVWPECLSELRGPTLLTWTPLGIRWPL